MPILKNIIKDKSNDYSDEEVSFEKKTGLKFVDTDKQVYKTSDLKISVSVIISCFMGHKILPWVLERFEMQSYKNFEVVIVDDGSPESMEKVVKEVNVTYPIKFIREEENMGRSYTRNTGMLFAEGECLIFIDQDIIVGEDFVFNFAVRQQFTNNCIYLGFKEDVEYEGVEKRVALGDYKKDWRFKVKGEKYFINLSLTQAVPDNPEREYLLLNETNKFKEFGMGRALGFWDLPAMVISHSLCVMKKSAVESGGFPEEEFEGWGAQDIAFGARLIGVGNFVVPVLNNVIFHVAHPRYSGSREIELIELKKNVESYFKMTEANNWNPSPKARDIVKYEDSFNKVFYILKEKN